jgi:hypothetical protein
MTTKPGSDAGFFVAISHATALQRRASDLTRKGRCSTLKLLHNFKSIPI